MDGSVAIIAVGAGGAVDTNTIHSPIVGFIFDQKGLMYNLTLEGSKISRISRYSSRCNPSGGAIYGAQRDPPIDPRKMLRDVGRWSAPKKR